MLVKTYGSAIIGVNAVTVTVEVTVSPGAGFSIVGLPDSAVKESGQRIASAFFESNFKIPNQNIVVNLAPADLKKEGSAYDLGIAMGVLGAVGMVKADDFDKYVIMGELGLDGSLRPIKGVLPIAIEARKRGCKGIIIHSDDVVAIGLGRVVECIEHFITLHHLNLGFLSHLCRGLGNGDFNSAVIQLLCGNRCQADGFRY